MGARVRVTQASDSTKWMEGVVKTLTGNAMTVTVDAYNGVSSTGPWDVNIAGLFGMTGGTGFTGKAPDLGAYEQGAPLPHYGPR